jgi:hypothetical protein
VLEITRPYSWACAAAAHAASAPIAENKTAFFMDDSLPILDA